jgi:TPR repeat protein
LTAARYFKLAADQNHRHAQNALAQLLWDGPQLACDLIAGAYYFKFAELSAEKGNPAAQLAVACMAENGIRLILFELLAGEPVCPESLPPRRIAYMVTMEHARAEIPDSVFPALRDLIADCWADDPDDRPTFEQIVDRLAEMEVKATENVNPAKLKNFVQGIEEWEMQNSRESMTLPFLQLERLSLSKRSSVER